MYKEVSPTFTEADMEHALARFDSTDPVVRNEHGWSTVGFDSRDGFWNPLEDMYIPPTPQIRRKS